MKKIHKKTLLHMQITVGNIFFNYQRHTIQLDYPATIYEGGATLNDDNVYSINKMLSWDLSTEVKRTDEPLEFADTYATVKYNICLIGIVALELAYGEIQRRFVENYFKLQAKYVRWKLLPNTCEDFRHKSADLAVDRALPFKKRRRFRDVEATTNSLITVTKENFVNSKLELWRRVLMLMWTREHQQCSLVIMFFLRKMLGTWHVLEMWKG